MNKIIYRYLSLNIKAFESLGWAAYHLHGPVFYERYAKHELNENEFIIFVESTLQHFKSLLKSRFFIEFKMIIHDKKVIKELTKILNSKP